MFLIIIYKYFLSKDTEAMDLGMINYKKLLSPPLLLPETPCLRLCSKSPVQAGKQNK